jgi:hypothetical protein
MIIKFLIIFLMMTTQALAFVPCSVTDWISILQVSISGAPLPVVNAQYDLETQYLWVLFNNNTGHFFVGVPVTQVQGVVKWPSIRGYHEALLQQGTWCPIQLSTGKPLLSR